MLSGQNITIIVKLTKNLSTTSAWMGQTHGAAGKGLAEVVAEAIGPIFTDLSNENLLERCVGGFY